MKLLNLKKVTALVCAGVTVLSLTGCQAVLDYVDSYVPPTTPAQMAATTPAADPGSTDPAQTTPAPTQPAQPTLVGVVTDAGVLNVRAGAGVEFDIVGQLEDGTKVAIYEQVPVGDSYWGRIKIGWISMNYVRIVDTGVSENTAIVDSVIATVTSENLNIRSGPSSNYNRLGSLTTGDKVQISEICVVGSTLWGKSKKGWVCMDYVSVDGSADGKLVLTGIVNANKLTIRSQPGSDHEEIGSYSAGQRIVITELQSKNYVPWGKTDKGWICMNYVICDGEIRLSAGS